MSIIRILVLASVASVVALTLAIQAFIPARWEHAYGVISPCGLFAVVVVYSDGSSVLFDSESPAPPALNAEILAAPQDRRTGIQVPCPSDLQGIPQIEARR